MARLVVPPRMRKPSISSESSSTSASSRIVVKKPSENTSRRASTRSVSAAPASSPSTAETLPLQINRPRRSTRLSTVHGTEDIAESKEVDRPASRNISGETLVSTKSVVEAPERKLLSEGINALNVDWKPKQLNDLPQVEMNDGPLQKRKSTRLSSFANALKSTASVLGKRGREVLESGKDKIQGMKENKKTNSRPQSMLESVVESEEPPRKRSKLSMTSASKTLTISETRVEAKPQIKGKKKWLSAGLYVGQRRDFNPRLNESQNRLKRASKTKESGKLENQVMPLPMFAGERLLEHGRLFKLPFDIFSPLPSGQPKPEDWRKTGYNRFIGDAASEWKENKHLAASQCLCTPESGCGDECLNRHMFYECDKTNCNIGSELCTNRAFAELKDRCKSGRKYDVGVEVLKTVEKGFGVRACRTFNPNQIIVEYAGEIITQEECERRMQEEYKNNECYYLMTFDQNMIIDATRGSIARFINHSCEPNCKMVKWTVAGKPRMALFAGDGGIMTGDELTYDYNFDPFSQKNVQTCHCGTPSCRGVLGPRVSKDKDKEDKKLKHSTSVLAGTKRKLQQLLGDSNAANKRTSSAQIKKRRATADGVTSLTVQSITKSQKRIASTASTLVEKENIPPSNRSRATSSRTSSTESKSRVAKLPSPARRNTLGSLSRLASSVKRNTSVLKLTGSLRRPTARASLPAKATLLAAANPSSTLEFTDETPRKVTPSKRAVTATKGRRASMKSPSTKSAAGGSIRKNVVRSVKGSRRADAMLKMGLGGKEKVGRSLRVVEGEEE